jgi:hypothetical protein
MDLVKVYVVGLQALQASLTLLDDVATAVARSVRIIICHSPVDLGCQYYFRPLAICL